MSPNHQRLVLADDFTGACDAGIQFAKHGISTSVLLGTPTFNGSTAVVVEDTETRNKTEESAYQTVRKSCRRCKNAGVELTYKKIDSSLRGNVGAELRALVDVFMRPIVVCPAYPEYERSVKNGRLMIRGIPVHKTQFAKDPTSPVRSSDIEKMLVHQANAKIMKISLLHVRKGPRSLTQTILRFKKKGFRYFCPDAEDRADLKNIAAACIQSHAIPCGSAGLAAEVASKLQPRRRKVVVLSSSTNEATLKELQRSARNSQTLLIRAQIARLTGRSRKQEISRIRQLVSHGLENHDVILVCSALYQKDLDTSLISRATGWGLVADPIASGLATAISPLALSGNIDGVLLTGGEMAAAFLKTIRASELELEKEILPGIPVGTVKLSRGRGLRVVTKAGGFGSRGSMRQIVGYLISH